MPHRRPILLLLCLSCLFCLFGRARADERPIVAELFTSQGCSSCPPAEALLGELATRPGLLALAMHIDYWDRLGWKDPYSSRAATARQKAYNAQFEVGGIYTPQMVVDGHWQAVGSDPGEIADAITLAKKYERSVPMTLAVSRGVARVAVAAGSAGDAGTVWLIGFDRRHDTTVRGGENAGRTVVQANVVRGLAPVGRFDGAGLQLEVPLAWHCEKVAALLQQGDGRVIGAAVAGAAAP
jgi:hypothetical protein